MRKSSLAWFLLSLTALTIAPCQGAEMKRIAISMIVEVPQLLESKEGVLKGLAESVKIAADSHQLVQRGS